MNKAVWTGGFAALIAVAFILLLATRGFGPDRSSPSVVVYSGRREAFVTPVLEAFEQQTGIRVQLLSGSATSFAHRLVEERRRPQADVFLANDAGVMEYLRLQGVLEPVEASGTTRIPAGLRAEDNSWVGLAGRVRVLMYNRDLAAAQDRPGSVFDLADPRYRGRFAMTRAGNSSLISHMAAIRATLGDERMREFVRALMANDPVIVQGHTDIRRMVGSGEVAFGLVNCYYYRLQRAEARHHDVGVLYPDQGPQEIGAFVNVAGMARIKDGPNADNAARLQEFLLEPERLRQFAELSLETPILPGESPPAEGRDLDRIKAMAVPLSTLGRVWADTLEAMEQAGFAE